MNEVSKLGQPEEEPIEGVIVPDYAGPGFNYWDIINEQVRQMYRKGSYHYVVDEDGIHDTANTYKTDWMQVFINGKWIDVGTTSEGVTYERGPSYPSTLNGWWDEAADFNAKTVETEFGVSPELADILSGGTIDRDLIGVHVALGQANEDISAPPVDPEKVKWPHAR